MSRREHSEHHVIPSSRGGKHTCSIPDNFHEAWHQCFQNLKPDEVIVFVNKLQNLMWTRQRITWDDINMLLNLVKEDGV